MNPLIARLVDHWKSHNLDIPPGVDQTSISEFEIRRGVRLPSDMREYFLTVNGMGEFGTCDEDWFSFWPFHEMKSIADDVPDRAHRFPDAPRYFLFADHSIGLPSIAIRLNERMENSANPVATVVTDFGCLFVQDFFHSFSDFISTYLEDPILASVLPDEVK